MEEVYTVQYCFIEYLPNFFILFSLLVPFSPLSFSPLFPFSSLLLKSLQKGLKRSCSPFAWGGEGHTELYYIPRNVECIPEGV